MYFIYLFIFLSHPLQIRLREVGAWNQYFQQVFQEFLLLRKAGEPLVVCFLLTDCLLRPSLEVDSKFFK